MIITLAYCRVFLFKSIWCRKIENRWRNDTKFLRNPVEIKVACEGHVHRWWKCPLTYRKGKPWLSLLWQGCTDSVLNWKYRVEPPVSGHPRDQKKCPLKSGVHLWEVKNAVFVCSWEHDQVSAYERCPLAEVWLTWWGHHQQFSLIVYEILHGKINLRLTLLLPVPKFS